MFTQPKKVADFFWHRGAFDCDPLATDLTKVWTDTPEWAHTGTDQRSHSTNVMVMVANIQVGSGLIVVSTHAVKEA
jgi:hypothetical protein